MVNRMILANVLHRPVRTAVSILAVAIEVVMVMMGDEPIDVQLPITIDLKVIETEVSTKTATITPQMKSSVVETGYKVDTPSFIKVGDVIKIETRTGNYVERVSTGK